LNVQPIKMMHSPLN